MEIITSKVLLLTPQSLKIREKSINWVFISLSLTHRAWGGGGFIQEQDGDADCTFIQRGQVPTFKGANVRPLI